MPMIQANGMYPFSQQYATGHVTWDRDAGAASGALPIAGAGKTKTGPFGPVESA
jgi:hypothetical protein